MRRALALALAVAVGGCGDDLPPPGPVVTTGGRLVAPVEVAVGRGFPVVFVADDPRASGIVDLGGAGPTRPLAFHRGRGVVVAVVEREGEVVLTAGGAELGAPA